MNIDWPLVIMAIGLAFIFEGLPYFLWAEKMPKILLLLAERKPSSLRGMGLAAIILGLALVASVRFAG